MGYARKRSQAMVIGTHEETRQMACTLIEESGFHVLEAESFEEAASLLARHGGRLHFVFAETEDARQARALAILIARNWPWIRVLVSFRPSTQTSELPAGASRLRHPWHPLDLLIETERVMH